MYPAAESEAKAVYKEPLFVIDDYCSYQLFSLVEDKEDEKGPPR